MSDETNLDTAADAQRIEAPPVMDSDLTNERDGVSFLSDEEVERAAEEIFRLHARLFEELAK